MFSEAFKEVTRGLVSLPADSVTRLLEAYV